MPTEERPPTARHWARMATLFSSTTRGSRARSRSWHRGRQGHSWCREDLDIHGESSNASLGLIRGSSLLTFLSPQSHPHIKPSSSLSGGPPLLLLPLRFPEPSPSTLTHWAQASLHLPALLSCFASTPGTVGSVVPVQPRGSAAWEYVKVYANCRIRRIWFSSEREGGEAGRGREELGLWPASGHASDDEGFS